MPIVFRGPYRPIFIGGPIPAFFGPAPYFGLLPIPATAFNLEYALPIVPPGTPAVLPRGISGVYVHGVEIQFTDNTGANVSKFLPLNVGKGNDVLSRLKSHYKNENFDGHPIFQIQNNVPFNNYQLQAINSSIRNYYYLKPATNALATIAAFTALTGGGCWTNVLWHNHPNFFNAIAAPLVSAYISGSGQTNSMTVDNILLAANIWGGGNWLNQLQLNRQYLVANYRCFYAEVDPGMPLNLVEGSVKWFLEQFGYHVYSHAAHLGGRAFNVVPPFNYDFTHLNDNLVQGVLLNPAGIVPVAIPNLVNII